MQIKLSAKNLKSVMAETEQCVAKGICTNPTFVVNFVLAKHYAAVETAAALAGITSGKTLDMARLVGAEIPAKLRKKKGK